MLVSQTENSSRVLLSILSFCLQHFLRITTFLDRYPAQHYAPEFIAYGGTTPSASYCSYCTQSSCKSETACLVAIIQAILSPLSEHSPLDQTVDALKFAAYRGEVEGNSGAVELERVP